jgi:hypothetical protein
MKKNIRSIVVFAVVFGALSCLPIVPVQTAPVIPDPVYKLTTLPLVGLFLVRGLVGVAYRWEWYTYAVILALLGFGIAASVFLSKKWNRSAGK